MIKLCIQKDASKRPSMIELLEHPFFVSSDHDELLLGGKTEIILVINKEVNSEIGISTELEAIEDTELDAERSLSTIDEEESGHEDV
jgi:hypothetical protein